MFPVLIRGYTKTNVEIELTILIIVIITLVLTENIKIGFYLTILYLFLLIKYNNVENFKSERGYSPLNCKTYGDSRKKTGSSFYPLHAMN